MHTCTHTHTHTTRNHVQFKVHTAQLTQSVSRSLEFTLNAHTFTHSLHTCTYMYTHSKGLFTPHVHTYIHTHVSVEVYHSYIAHTCIHNVYIHTQHVQITSSHSNVHHIHMTYLWTVHTAHNTHHVHTNVRMYTCIMSRSQVHTVVYITYT